MISVKHIPKYTNRDFPVMVATMLPMAVLMNYFLFDNRYWLSIKIFGWATIVTFTLLAAGFLSYGWVALLLRNRLPHEDQSSRRLTISILLFMLMSGVYVSVMLTVYDLLNFLGYDMDQSDFRQCYLLFIVFNIFLTFLNEWVYKFEKYQATIIETEQLKKEYMQSQLLGLRSQMNPHFLFNSLNTLSSLINEDAEKAEDFLDHMSKVYRYLLRNNEEQLVSLRTELSFIQSYYYLLKARYAEGLQLGIEISNIYLEQLIPPLTLQMIVENTINQNTISRSDPLHMTITAGEQGLTITNNVRPKINSTELFDEGIENITNKFRLLCQQDIYIAEDDHRRIIQLPLLPCNEKITT